MIDGHFCLENEHFTRAEKTLFMLGSMFPIEKAVKDIAQYYLTLGFRKTACRMDSRVCGSDIHGLHA
jgi:hypothetical protein